MESPVRICFCAALVVSVLLLSSTTVSTHSLPESSLLKDERLTNVSRANATWPARRTRKSDIALNELKHKDASTEEHNDKNAKYKDRGRIRYHSRIAKESTFRKPRNQVSTETPASEAPKLIIITPTPEVKKPAQIIDSMRTYKKNKMVTTSPNISTTHAPDTTTTTKRTTTQKIEITTFPDTTVKSFTPTPINEVDSAVEDADDEDDNNHRSTKYSDKFFKIPNFSFDVSHSDASYETPDDDNKFSKLFPDNIFGSDKYVKNYESENFFNFDSELTTPRNYFFDKRYEKISEDIKNNLKTAKRKAPSYNDTNTYRIFTENSDLSKLSNGTPSNKSTVIIKNTKEVRLLDNEKAGTSNKELSDVHGTSIYYEMSVLSTETYNIDQSNDDDCDNDAQPEPTRSTSTEEELISANTPQHLQPLLTTEPLFNAESLSTVSSNYLPISSIGPTFYGSVPFSTQIPLSSTERSTRVFSSNFTRDRNYSKRLRLGSPNSVTSRTNLPVSNQNFRIATRKFYSTTPKTKSVWIAPRRNYTRTPAPRPLTTSTIYSEHFSINDKYPEQNDTDSSKNLLTTVTSEIDPVLQGDGGVKKVVHQHSISDNSIPSLWKRGSTKYSTTATSAEVQSDVNVSEMEIPPTLTAWALASLISPPAGHMNTSTHKSVDENELQKVGDLSEKKETTPSSLRESASSIANDINLQKANDIDQNKVPWRPISLPPLIEPEVQETNMTTTERLLDKINTLDKKSDDDSNVANKPKRLIDQKTNNESVFEHWVPVTERNTKKNIVHMVDATKSTGFESITKLGFDITTPPNSVLVKKQRKPVTTTPSTEDTTSTTDYDLTTVKIYYAPTKAIHESNPEITTYSWHRIMHQKEKVPFKDEPITTYRPKLVTTTDYYDETTSNVPDSVFNSNKNEPTTTTVGDVTEYVHPITESQENILMSKLSTTTESVTEPSTLKTTTTNKIEPSETSTTIEVVTEIIQEQSTGSDDTSSAENTNTETSESESGNWKLNTEDYSASNEVISSKPQTTTTTQSVVTTTEKSKVETTTVKTDVFTTEKDIETTVKPTERTAETTTVVPTETNAPTTKRSEVTTTENNIVTQNATITGITKHNEVSTKITVTTKMSEVSTKISETTKTNDDSMTESAETTTKLNDGEDSGFGDLTTEASLLLPEQDLGSGATIAIAVSTIGVIALLLLIGLLVIVRRRGRRGVYAQRCTPVSLDAYSLDNVSVGQRKGQPRHRASKRSYGNPAYDDEQVTSHPMQYPALANFAMDVESISAEFYEIPSVTVKPEEVPPGCEDKNRYSNVLPLPETRVPLRRVGNDPTTEYINANYITGPGNIRNYYIACQGPLENTVSDFWRMVWEQNSRVIVNLTEFYENGVEKCYEYVPPSEISDNKRTFGNMQVILVKREQRDKYTISSIQLINTITRTWREITLLWYLWPLKGVPDDYDSIIDFLSEMRSYMKMMQSAKEYDEEGLEVIYGDQSRSSIQNLSKLKSEDNGSTGVNVYSPARAEQQLKRDNKVTNGTLSRIKVSGDGEGVRPCVVVCSSGAGRSAALIAADICARALAAAAVDVPRVVREIRAQRPHSLTNRHHYIFLYKLLSEYGNKLMGGGGDTI